MEIKAKLKHLRISPRKVRLVAGLIRGMETNKAIEQLKFMNKKAAKPVEKLLNSGIANAVNNYELDDNNLFIKEIKVDDGVTLKRWMPRAHGRATPLRKRSSHVEIVLKEIKESNKKVSKKQKIEAPVKLSDMNKGADKTKATETKEIDKKDKDIKKAEKDFGEKNKKGFVGKMFRRKSS